MSDCHYITPAKRQELAHHLSIPEQCVNDYFKNLRSRNKNSERSMPLPMTKMEEPEEQECGSADTPSVRDQSSLSKTPLAPLPLCHSTPAHQAPPIFRQRPPTPKSPEQDLVASKIASLGKRQSEPSKQTSAGGKVDGLERQTLSFPSVESLPLSDLSVLHGSSLFLQDGPSQSFEVGQEIFVMPVASAPTSVHISPTF